MSLLVRTICDNIRQHPDFTVIRDAADGSAFTFRQLDEFARKIAAKLRRLGVAEGDFVTIELPRNKEYIAAIVAAWLIGAAYAPLSPDYPEERLSYIRSDCGAKAVIN